MTRSPLPTARERRRDASPAMGIGSRVRRRSCLVLACAALALLGVASPAAAAESSAAAVFSKFESAWRMSASNPAAKSKAVAKLMDPRGKLRVSLAAPRALGGTWSKAQVESGLEKYFARRGVVVTALKAVRSPVPNTKVRLYDYTYRPYQGDPVTARLTVTVKQDAAQKWVLASIIETQRTTARLRPW